MPNDAYNETCAAIANALWNHRLFLLHGDAKYLDVLERILYNGFLAGVSMSGDRFFYPNPLVCDGRKPFNQGTLGRAPWFRTACCPVNVVRFVPSIPGFLYAVDDDGISVNLFSESEARVPLHGQRIRLSQRTDYPWSGRIRVTVDPQQPTTFQLKVRIPGWARGRPVPSDLCRYAKAEQTGWTVTLNDQPVEQSLQKGFIVLNRRWRSGDTVELNLPMPVRRVLAHDAVKADAGRVALERGPLVYCFEAVDNGGDVADLVVPDDATFQCERRADLSGGVTVIRVAATRVVRNDDGTLTNRPVEAVAIPYYAWAHRTVGPMAVWMPRRPE
ncbi:MAG TPA: glycoside hydrolase family 127 protein, partial [Planctomycetaceae bacterium]|nr:glycoside hydrolase family 127 protein [Planctomycetaceae bacterium]